MRYAYIKNGNVIEQLSRLDDVRHDVPTSGPDAFIGDFLRSVAPCPVMLLSCDEEESRLHKGNIFARVLRFSRRETQVASKLKNLCCVFFSVFSMLKSFRADRVLCGTHGPTLWAAFLYCKLNGILMVHSSHNSLETHGHGFHRKLFNTLDRYCVRRADAAIGHGPYIRQQLLALGVPSDRVFEFDIGFKDMLPFLEAGTSGSTERNNARVEICYVGRMEADKGIYDLLEASRDILKKDNRVKLVYAGNGSHFEQFKSRVERMGMTSQVDLLGAISHERVAQVMGKAKVVVTPTRSVFPEARCMAAMESLFLGVPVIAPDSGPFPYLIENGVNGLLYRTDAVEALREALVKVLHDEKLYATLQAGAAKSSKRLLHPTMTFAQAVERAFAACPTAGK